MAVVIEQLIPVSFDETRPTIFFRDDAGWLVCAEGRHIRCLRPLVGHLEKQQVRQLLRACPERSRRIIVIAHPIVPEDVTVIPELLDDLRRIVGHMGRDSYIPRNNRPQLGARRLRSYGLDTEELAEPSAALSRSSSPKAFWINSTSRDSKKGSPHWVQTHAGMASQATRY